MDDDRSPSKFDDPDTEDAMFEILGAAPRRSVLQYLTTRSTPATVDQLVAVVAANACDETTEAVTDDERDRVRLALTHVHLPKLARAGLVRIDPVADEVSLTPQGRQLSLQYPNAGDAGRVTFSFRLPATR